MKKYRKCPALLKGGWWVVEVFEYFPVKILLWRHHYRQHQSKEKGCPEGTSNAGGGGGGEGGRAAKIFLMGTPVKG